MYSAVKIFEQFPNFPSCHASTIAELPNGDLFAAWYAGSREGAKDVAIFTSRCSNGSERWMHPEMVVNTPNCSEGNPVLFVDANGQIWLFYVTMYGNHWKQCKVYYQKSNTMGNSWDERGVLRDELGWMTRNKPVYDERNWHSMVMISSNGGETWNTYGDLSSPKGVIQPTVVQRGDGSLLMLMRSRDGEIWRSTSNDLGRSWEAAYPTAELIWPVCTMETSLSFTMTRGVGEHP